MITQLYNQPLAHRVGNELIALLTSAHVTSFEFAVAWVRRSGTEQLAPSVVDLLRRGGSAKGTVGIDIENTSVEGLNDLLAWSKAGNAQFYVYHDENPVPTFHPKVFLLRSKSEATMIVGSTNITGAGLYFNTEVNLLLSAAAESQMIRQAESMLEAWRDVGSPFVRRLDAGLLASLEQEGYVLREEVLRQRRRASTSKAPERRDRVRLFGRSKLARMRRTPTPRVVAGSEEGAVLLMRVRRASENERRTQIQIPIRVRRTSFFDGIEAVRSSRNGEQRGLHEAQARNTVNTIKLEIPEIDTFGDPVMRFERADGEVTYYAFDSSSPGGRQIMNALKAGLNDPNRPTLLTTPSKPKSATWWRFV